MHLDKEDFNVFMFLKFGIVVAIFTSLPFWIALASIIFISVFYREVVAKFSNLHVMPIMDLNCFYSNDKATANIIFCNE